MQTWETWDVWAPFEGACGPVSTCGCVCVRECVWAGFYGWVRGVSVRPCVGWFLCVSVRLCAHVCLEPTWAVLIGESLENNTGFLCHSLLVSAHDQSWARNTATAIKAARSPMHTRPGCTRNNKAFCLDNMPQTNRRKHTQPRNQGVTGAISARYGHSC